MRELFCRTTLACVLLRSKRLLLDFLRVGSTALSFKIVAAEQDLPDYVKQAKKELGADGDCTYGVIAPEPAIYIRRIKT